MFDILREAESAGGAEELSSLGTRETRFADGRAAPDVAAGVNFLHLNAAFEPDLRNGGSPLEALRRVVRGYLELARRCPACGPLLFTDRELARAEDGSGWEAASALQTIASHVRAAQQAGELKSGDAEHIAILLLGAIVGAVDLTQSGRVRAASAIRDLEALPLVLVNRLAVKRAH